MTDRPSAFAPFRYQTFRSLWVATLLSNLGSLVQAVGAGWLMTELTSSHDMVALVQAMNTLPIMLFALAAGALADNYDKRVVMLTAQVFMCVVSGLLALAAWWGMVTPWSLLAFTFLIGSGGALMNPAWQSSMRDLVPREDVPAAVALNSMGFNAMRSVGPAIGGLIVAAAGPPVAFAINAVSYVTVILGLGLWRPAREERALPREGLGAAMAAGLRYVAMSPNLVTVIVRASAFGFSAVSILALLPVVARDVLGGGAFIYGVLLGAFGLGAIGGALLSPRVRERFDTETVIRLSFLVFAIGASLLGLSRSLPLSIVALLLTGSAWVQALSLFNVSVQLSTPRWVVGRALALYQSATFGGMAVGSWVWGALSDRVGIGHALIVSGLTLILGAAIGLRWRLSEFSDLNLDPLGRFSEPHVSLDLKARSGPVVVQIEWRIEPQNVDAFLALMTQRRRIRLRDGARHWVLLRDLEQPQVWLESYRVPTWTEYVRHNTRRTQADADVGDRLNALHAGPGRPVVHRMIERQTVPTYDDTPVVNYPKIPSGA